MTALTLINTFEVAPEGRERAPAGPATLFRALRSDVRFRFVAVEPVDSPQDQENVYDVVREHGTPDVEGGVVMISPFEVPDDEDERLLARWDGARAVLERQRGYLGARLHRSVGPADFRFVDIARWSSPLMVARARNEPSFQQAAIQFPSHPALYL
jgi:heme-degrading monooxygenase HmoA